MHFLLENSLYLLLALACVFTCVWLLLLRDRLNMSWYAAIGFSVLHVVYGVLCVKVFAVMEGNPLSGGAMSLFGAVFFMPIAYLIGAKVSKRKVSVVFDIFAICMIFTLMCARINCLFAGCCLGKQISSLAVTRWPTRELELAFYVIFLGCMIPKVWNDKSHGIVYPVYMISYGVVRFVLEFFRVSSTNTLFHISHLWAFMSFIIGLGIYIEIHQQHPTPKKKTRA